MTASGLELKKIILALVLTLLVLTLIASGAKAQEIQPDADQSQSEAMRDGPDAGDTAESVLPSNEDQLPVDVTGFFDRRWADRLLPAALTFGVMSLAPALLLMTTCFVRMSVVLSLTRQAIGTVNLPSTQIITSLALFLSALVMWPIWTSAYQLSLIHISEPTRPY